MVFIPTLNGDADADIDRWKKLTEGLFVSLKTLVATKGPFDLAAERRRLEEWEPFAITRGAREEAQYNAMHALLWCAGVAVQTSSGLDELSRPLFNQMLRPNLKAIGDAWLFDCVCELLPYNLVARSSSLPTGTQPKLEVPVALCDEEIGLDGLVASLCLELRAGSGEVFQHPADTALKHYATSTFHRSMKAAWTSAMELAGRRDCDGRWRLLLPSSVREVDGDSAGGAAARGWLLALTGRVSDPEVIVLAAVDGTGALKGVGGIKTKVKVAADEPGIDTIVVVTEKDRQDAMGALAERRECFLTNEDGAEYNAARGDLCCIRLKGMSGDRRRGRPA